MRGSSTGTPTRPTRRRSGRISGRWHISPAPARSARAAPCCRAWPPAGPAAASSPSTTRASTRPPPATTAPAPATWSKAAAPGTCAPAAWPSTPRSPPRSWPRWSRRRCRPACKPPGRSSKATTRPWPSTGARSSRPATRPPGPSAATRRSTRTTGWSPAAWKPPGRKPSPSWPPPRPSSPAARQPAPPTTDKDRKQLLRTLLDEVNITVHRDHDSGHADLVLRWTGGAITELAIPVKRTPPRRLRTDEDTVGLIRRLAVHYPDAKIAGILNRQHRTTARGMSYTASRVQSLRHHWKIPCYQPGDDPQEGELLTVADAAAELGLAPSTLHRWLNDGFIAGEQLTPAAPWRIRLTPDIRALFVDDAPDGWLAMLEATLAYRVSRQTIMQRVKDGRLRAVHVRTGRRKGLRIEPPARQDGLF